MRSLYLLVMSTILICCAGCEEEVVYIDPTTGERVNPPKVPTTARPMTQDSFDYLICNGGVVWGTFYWGHGVPSLPIIKRSKGKGTPTEIEYVRCSMETGEIYE